MARLNRTRSDDAIDGAQYGGSATSSDETFAMTGNDCILLERTDPTADGIIDKVHGSDGNNTLMKTIFGRGRVGIGSTPAGYSGNYFEMSNSRYICSLDGIVNFRLDRRYHGDVSVTDATAHLGGDI